MKRVLIGAALTTACAGAAPVGSASPDACPPDSTLYSYADTARNVIPPVVVRSSMPRDAFGRITAQGIVGRSGRIERGSVRTSGGAEGRLGVGDALFWSRFAPATRDGCPVRFLYRVTYMHGIPQRVPDEIEAKTEGKER
jgi:hypothetical protein